MTGKQSSTDLCEREIGFRGTIPNVVSVTLTFIYLDIELSFVVVLRVIGFSSSFYGRNWLISVTESEAWRGPGRGESIPSEL